MGQHNGDGSNRATDRPACLRVAGEIAWHVLAYNLTRVMNIMGTGRLIAAMQT